MEISRRNFIKLSAAAFAIPAILPLQALGNDFWSRPRSLHLKRTGTSEEVVATYWADGALIEDGYRQLNYILRDKQAGVIVNMDVVLLDILRGIQGWFLSYGQDRPIHINSGYRTPYTNSHEGGARNSWHMRAAAADIVMPGVPLEYMSNLAHYLHGGGVGIYPSKGMLHVDKGNVRTWYG